MTDPNFDREEHKAEHKRRIGKIKEKIRNRTINAEKLHKRLVEEYGRLEHEGDPVTEELREQIHDQIKKLEADEND